MQNIVFFRAKIVTTQVHKAFKNRPTTLEAREVWLHGVYRIGFEHNKV